MMTTASATNPPSIAGLSGDAQRLPIWTGVVAGPLFIAVALGQIATLPGFDLSIHPVSALSLGATGWVQIANFVVTGILVLVTAVLLHRRLAGQPGGALGPVFVGAFGVGLIVSGLFVADPAFGFPAGAPSGMPVTMSWHSIVHNTAAQLAFACLLVAAITFIRIFARREQKALMFTSIATPILVLAVMFAPIEIGFSLRMFVGSAVVFAWLSAVSFATERPAHPRS